MHYNRVFRNSRKYDRALSLCLAKFGDTRAKSAAHLLPQVQALSLTKGPGGRLLKPIVGELSEPPRATIKDAL